MAIANPYAKYQNSKILTASPAELTLMLYDGIIKFTNIAITAAQEKDFEKANLNIMKAERIVDHLKATLDHNYEVAKDFDSVYDCMMDAMVQGNIRKAEDLSDWNRALEYARMIRDTWKEVMKATGKDKAIEK